MKMKINIILPFTALTGGIRVVFLYSNYLVSQGHDVTCYVPMKAYKFNRNFLKVIKSSIANTIKNNKKISWFNCKFRIKLVPIIHERYIRDADITIATAWPTAKDLNKLSKKKGKKVYFIQDYEIWSGKTIDVDNSYKLPLNRIVITKNLQKLLKSKFSVNSTLIYNGLIENEFLLEEKKINDKKTIMMLYNEAPNKGTKEGLDILWQIKQKHDIRVILFGFKKSKLIPSEFEFYQNPSREKLIDLYRQSDIYLFPSKHESWGLPVLEAMANKCVVVGNNVGCLSEIAEHNHNAIIIENLDYDKMKKQTEILINNESLIKNLQNNGYELAKKFKWNDSFIVMENYLKSLI